MSVIQQLVTIALAAVTNFITRWLPKNYNELPNKK